MKKIKSYYIIFICLFFMISCSKEQKGYQKDVQISKSKESQEDLEARAVGPITLIKAVKTKKIPFKIDDNILKNNELESYNDIQIKKMGLMKLPAYSEHHKYIPIASFKLHNNFHTILILQYYLEESFCWLINYSLTGDYLAALKVYYDCSEGMEWTGAMITNDEIIVEEGSIYENNGKPTKSSYNIDKDGHFVKQ